MQETERNIQIDQGAEEAADKVGKNLKAEMGDLSTELTAARIQRREVKGAVSPGETKLRGKCQPMKT